MNCPQLEKIGIYIPSKYVVQLSTDNSDSVPNKLYSRSFRLAAHIHWIRQTISEKKVPSKFPKHESLKDDQVHAFLQQGALENFDTCWTFLHLTVYNVSSDVTKCYKKLEPTKRIVRKPSGNTSILAQQKLKKSWPPAELVDFIGEANFNFTWEQPYISFLDLPETTPNVPTDEQIHSTEDVYFQNLLNILYNYNQRSNELVQNTSATITTTTDPTQTASSTCAISNLTQPLCVLKISKNTFLVFHKYSRYSLQDCVNFSPEKLLSSNVKLLFVLYQILQFIYDLELLNIPIGDITLSSISTDECLFINIQPNLRMIMKRLEIENNSLNGLKFIDEKVAKFLQFCVKTVKNGCVEDLYDSNFDAQLVESVIRYWCEGLITNFDYLMFLNYLCGRVCNTNPNYHPVFPWVSDFSSPNGGWRDLTKSKFRLNKGEKQLTLMFEEKGSLNTTPHHITDILSEITYYVYKARQSSKELLCKFVRPKWVPAEYPISIERIYCWTPDECIPEFYFDPSIFKSIHSDLPDLALPSWCSSPQEFIKMHSCLLESDQVSSKLHHWIDQVFGYKLCGSAAIRSKNVYLSLVDKHQNLMKNGIVQLFQTPHPPRRCERRDYKNIVSYTELKKMRENDTDREKDFITLPKHYDPMGFLNDFEVSINFFKTHFNTNSGVKLKGLKSKENATTEYIKLFGCLLVELIFPTKVQHIANTVRNINKRFEFYQQIMNTLEPIPLFIRRTVQAIFSSKKSLEYHIPLEISTYLLLLTGDLSPIPFPKYFEQMYKLVKSLRDFDSSLSVADPFDSAFCKKIAEMKVKSFSRDLIQMINEFDEDGLDLIMPFVLDLFQNHSTRVLAVWNLFCPIARAIGREKAVSSLLDPIVQIYESDYNSDKHLKLFHRSFILQLQSCFGLKQFLENFATLIIEPIGGWKHLENGTITSRPTHLKNCFDEIECTTTTQTKPVKILSSQSTIETDCDDSSSGHEIETEIFVMEPEISDSEDSSNNPQPPKNVSVDIPEQQQVLSYHEQGDTTSNVKPPRDSSSSITTDSRNTKSTENDITEMCCESLIWLVHRLGPVLTAKYISKNLLRMLTLCYISHLDMNDQNQVNCDGNCHTERIHECLLAINDLYGNCFIERQYIPYCVEVVNSARAKLSPTLEAALVGVASLLERIVTYVDDSVLAGLLNDNLLPGLLKPIVTMIVSPEVQFPSGFGPRVVLIDKTLNIIATIRQKIGPDISQQVLKPLVLEICAKIQQCPQEIEDAKVKQNFHLVFNKTLAHRIFTNFYEMVVGCEYETVIQDLYLLQGQKQIQIKGTGPSWEKEGQRKKIESQSSFGSRSFGNKIMVQENDSNNATCQDSNSISVNSTSKDTTRHIKGNWLIYWEHEIGRSDSRFYFKQIKLQTFSGHTASVRSIYSMNNENSFLTGSKDRTCRVYSLRNQGDESTVLSHKWAYTHHKKAVLNVLFNEQLHLAASTDGRVHIWDPFVGKHIRILETKSICCLKPIGDSCAFVGAGTEYCVVVDPRTCHTYELRMGIGQNMGMVRCMTVTASGNVVSVGHSSGMLSSLDLRNGNLMGSWKAHEGEILQLASYGDRYLISSSLDQNLLVWNLDDKRLAFNMRGPTEPIISLNVLNSELITCSTSNRIGVHSRIDSNSDFSSTKLRSDTCKGTVTTLNLLPLNQALLVGSDSGLVYLIC